MGTDDSADAVALAARNAAHLGLGRVVLRQGHWFEPAAGQVFDVIASNPPYIAEGDPRVDAAVRRYEPHHALFSGATGLEALAEIVKGAPRHLRHGGWIVLEHGDRQGVAVRQLLLDARFEQVATHRDLAGLDRVTEGCWR